MYKITYIHKDETTENVLYQPGDREYCLSAGTLNLGAGTSGELSICIPQTNPATDDFACLTDEVIAYRDDKEIWRGRAMTRQYDFYLTGTLTCEGVLSYLYDTYFPPFEFQGSLTAFLEMVLENHNSQVEDRKKIYLGNVTVKDNNDYINRSSIYYDRTLTVLTEKLINDSLGGYFRIRIEDGVKYLDYLESYGTTATQAVEFGSNLLDIAQNVEYSDLATVILPIGAKLEDDDGNETDEYLTIESVNDGSIYYADEAAVEEYGWIAVSVEWEDVTEASNLLTKAKNYLAQVTSAVASFDVNAVDLALLSDAYEAFNIGDYILIQSEPHGVNQYVELTEMNIDLLDPSNDTLIFGSDTASLVGSQKTSERAVQTALESLSVRFTNLAATVITVDYLNANYITADEISANYITADDLKATIATFGYVTADEIEATVATFGYLTAEEASITYLTAESATITELTADVANINNILAGNVGSGTVQTVHLTADNSVIDEAVITEALINDATIGSLLAGTIYTSFVTIRTSEDSNGIYIADDLIAMYDENDVMRLQAGSTDSLTGESNGYNFVVWDADGAQLFNATGITATGIPSETIVDAHVASNAAISGEKLNIKSVIQYINEDGSITVDYANVLVNETTLDYALTSVTSTAQAAQDAADAAQATADAAAADAATAQEAAEAAATDAATAQAAADEAAQAAQDAQDEYDALVSRADATDDELAAAQEKLTAAQEAADAAQEAADTAAANATAAKEAADTAQATAEAAQEAAEAAQDAVDAVESRTTVLETELEVVQGQITAKVWETDITEAIEGLVVGTRNYVLNSGDYTVDSDTSCIYSDYSAFYSYYTVTACDGYMHIECTTATSSTAYMDFYLSDSFSSYSAESYILTVRIRASKASALTVQLTRDGGSQNNNSITPSTADEWETLTIAVTPNTSYSWTGIGFALSNYKALGDYVDIAWIKLEAGTVATDWTPAPEDTVALVTTLTDKFATISVSLDGISSTVGELTTTLVYAGVVYRNYALNSGNYTEDGEIGWHSNYSSTFSDYYTITAHDGYVRIECIQANSSQYRAYLSLSDDFDTSVYHSFSIKMRLSNPADMWVGYRYYTDDSSSASFGYWTASADLFTSGEWTIFTKNRTTIASGRTATDYGIDLQNVNTVGDYVDIAYFMLEEGDETHDWEPAPEDNDLTGVLYLGSKLSDISQTVSSINMTVCDISATTVENIIADGTFENYFYFGTSYSWYRSSSSYITLSEYDGKPCIAFSYASTNYLRQAISIPAGTYLIKAKLACGEGYTPVVCAKVGANTTTSAYLCSDGDLTTEWVTYSAIITLTSASTHFWLYCYPSTSSTTTTATECYVTDIVMYNTSEAENAVSASLVLSIEEDSDGNKYGVISANADYIYLKAGDLVIESDQLTLDVDGNADFGGTLSAPSGTIGGWTLTSNRLYTMCDDTSDEDYGKHTILRKAESSSNWVIVAGGTDTSTYSAYPFRVTKSGKLYCENTTVSRLFGLDSNGDQRTLAYLDSDTDYYYYGYGDITNRIYVGSDAYTEYLMLYGDTIRAYGEFYCYGWGNTTLRKPIQTVSTDGSQVVYMSSNVNSSGTYYVAINAQYGTTGSTYSSHNFTYASSDIRLKENVTDTEVEALPVIRQMQLRQFDWKQVSAHQDIGFVADELDEIDSKFSIGGGLNEEGQPNYKSIDTLYMLGYVVKAIQEMDADAVLIGGRVYALEAQLDAAYLEIAELKNKLQAVA